MDIKFGPAGLGPVKGAEEKLEEYSKLGFRACEIAFTYSNYIKKKEDAVRIGEKARELGIELSIHGSYFINLNSDDKDKIEASKKRILDACEIGEWLGAKCVVFHPGYYGKNKEGAYEKIKLAILDLMAIRKKKGWKIEIAPETMGKVNVFGSVDEISRLVKETGCGFCIDFAHILAREKSVDYGMVAEAFPNKDWHCHFSGIIYGEKGEKKHRETEAKEWKLLLKELKKINKNVRIANESPQMIEDSVSGLEIAKKLGISS
jgi:deoxyribonuclease IV